VGVVRPLEIELRRRGVTVLTGSNGVGKSVLLGAAAGARSLDQVAVEWLDGSGPPPILATQYPEHQLFEERVGEELVWAAMSRGLSRAEANARTSDCLRALGIDSGSFLARRAWNLSGGEKRLLMVVATLVAPASLAILDEPTAGLDAGRRRAMATLVNRRAEIGPVLIASQDAGWISRLCARVIQLGPGSGGSAPSPSKKTD
jgi:energy-coupling factor transporter ATP-binding protein EcfA2